MKNRVLINNPIEIENFDHLKSLISNKETKYFAQSSTGPVDGCYEISYDDMDQLVIAERRFGNAVLNDKEFEEEYFTNLEGKYYVSSYFYVNVLENNILSASFEKEIEYLKSETIIIDNINERLESQGLNLDEHISIVSANDSEQHNFSDELENKLRDILNEYMIDSNGRRI